MRRTWRRWSRSCSGRRRAICMSPNAPWPDGKGRVCRDGTADLRPMNLHELSERLAAGYDLPRSVTCELLRSYTNDVYAVQSRAGRFVLKVYGKGWRTASDIEYEVALLRHLSAKGLPAADPIAAGNQNFLQE